MESGLCLHRCRRHSPFAAACGVIRAAPRFASPSSSSSRPLVRSFPLDQAADAQRLLAEGHSGGKIVLTVA